MQNKSKSAPARILVVAGSDSGGGAGVQGDIKTITLLGGYAATAITALTAQNTQGVYDVQAVPAAFVALQMQLVLEDIGADIVKTGMLHSAEIVHAVADRLAENPSLPLILDPVMFSTSGRALLNESGVAALKERLIPRALLCTPNLPEAAALAGWHTLPQEEEGQQALAEAVLALGCQAVLLKGGHAEGTQVTDRLVTKDATHRFTSPRMPAHHTHGTGCALASAIATYYAQGVTLAEAVQQAHGFVQQAIAHAPQLGKGNGPLGFGIWKSGD